jgi:hypothetical protein
MKGFWLALLVGMVALGGQVWAQMEFTHASTLEQLELESRLSLEFATPHVKWASPPPGGPVRALFIIHVTDPDTNAREVVEVMQRFGIEAGVAYEKDGIFYAGKVGAQRLADLLKQRYDVFVFGNTNLEVLPKPLQYELLKQVVEGAGLVCIGPRPEKIMSASRKEAEVPAALTLGTGLSALVENRGTSEELARQVLTCYRLKQGRGLHIDYTPIASLGASALTPKEEFTWAALARYEYWSAFIGRAILWAAGRDLTAHVMRLTGEGAVIKVGQGTPLEVGVVAADAPKGLVWEGSVCRLSDGARWPATLVVAGDAGAAAARTISVAVPALRADEYMLELRASDEKRPVGFVVMPFTVASEDRVESVTLDRDFAEVGESLEATITVKGTPREGDKLVLRGRDSYGRVVWQEERPVPASGSCAVQVKAVPAFSLWMRLEAAWVRGGQELSCATSEFKVTHRNREHYAMVMWDAPPDVLGYHGVQRMNEAGFNVNLRGGPPLNTIAAFGWAQIPYTTRILDEYDQEGRMKPCSWNDEAAIEAHVRGIASGYVASREHGVYAYSLGDETTTIGASTDPTDLAAYRQWLRGQYADIGALNASWGSEYKSFDEVDLLGYGTAQGADLAMQRLLPGQGLSARWFDRQAFARHNYLQLCARFGRVYKEMDPEARTGFEGAGSFADDIEAIVGTNGFWSPYYGPHDEVLRSLAPKRYPHSNWIGYEHQVTPILGNAIRTVSNGCTSLYWWRWDNIGQYMGYLNADLDYFPTTKALTEEMRPVRYGLGDWIMDADRQHDGIAILHSLASALAPQGIAGMFSGQCENAHGGAQLILEDIGLQYSYVTERQVMEGVLDSGQYQVLLLPQTLALNPKAAEAIMAFARKGGKVVADMVPGKYDHHLAPLAQPSLASLFGAGGAGVLLNLDFTIYDRPRGETVNVRDQEEGAAMRAEVARVLSEAGVRCPAQMERLDGGKPVRVEMVRWRQGEVELIGLFHYPIGFYDNAPYAAPARVRLRFDQPRYWTMLDLRLATPMGRQPEREVEVSVEAGRMKFIVTSARPLGRVEAQVGAREGQRLPITLTATSPEPRPVHLVALDQNGKALPWFDEVVVVQGGKARVEVPLAVDGDPALKTIRVTDWFANWTQHVPVAVR